MVGSAAVWPARSVRRQAQDVDVETGPLPGVGVLGGERWLLVWGRDPLGECCCWRGTVRTGQGARAGNCTNPGKHPWVIRVDGQLYGFEHGAADALDWVDLADRYGPPGGSSAAGRGAGRAHRGGPGQRAGGAGLQPGRAHRARGADPGGLQHAEGLPRLAGRPGLEPEGPEPVDGPVAGPWGGWSGTDERKAGRRGFLLDVRTGRTATSSGPARTLPVSAGGSPGGTSGR
jgi:hypothetical protein